MSQEIVWCWDMKRAPKYQGLVIAIDEGRRGRTIRSGVLMEMGWFYTSGTLLEGEPYAWCCVKTPPQVEPLPHEPLREDLLDAIDVANPFEA